MDTSLFEQDAFYISPNNPPKIQWRFYWSIKCPDINGMWTGLLFIFMDHCLLQGGERLRGCEPGCCWSFIAARGKRLTRRSRGRNGFCLLERQELICFMVVEGIMYQDERWKDEEKWRRVLLGFGERLLAQFYLIFFYSVGNKYSVPLWIEEEILATSLLCCFVVIFGSMHYLRNSSIFP